MLMSYSVPAFLLELQQSSYGYQLLTSGYKQLTTWAHVFLLDLDMTSAGLLNLWKTQTAVHTHIYKLPPPEILIWYQHCVLSADKIIFKHFCSIHCLWLVSIGGHTKQKAQLHVSDWCILCYTVSLVICQTYMYRLHDNSWYHNINNMLSLWITISTTTTMYYSILLMNIVQTCVLRCFPIHRMFSIYFTNIKLFVNKS